MNNEAIPTQWSVRSNPSGTPVPPSAWVRTGKIIIKNETDVIEQTMRNKSRILFLEIIMPTLTGLSGKLGIES